jgi:hypothetical protein
VDKRLLNAEKLNLLEDPDEYSIVMNNDEVISYDHDILFQTRAKQTK